MARKDLDEAIGDILEDFESGVITSMQEATEAVTKAAVKEVRSNSRVFGGTGKYAKGWKAKTEKGRLAASGVVYNASLPGLPHLLEFGHAKRGGGRTQGVVHIAPVERMVEEKFVRELERKV